jgi:hypothetical protein
MDNEEIAKRLASKIKEKVEQGPGGGRCPICATNNWGTGWYVGLPASRHPSKAMGGQMYPCVALICNNCGNVQLLNLPSLGFGLDDFDSLERAE